MQMERTFHVTELGHYNGKPQISAADMYAVEAPFGDVAVWTPNRPIALQDLHRNVAVAGTIQGGGEGCGAANLCWDLAYDQGVITFRTDRPVGLGDCVRWVGPVGAFGAEPQLDLFNEAWVEIDRVP